MIAGDRVCSGLLKGGLRLLRFGFSPCKYPVPQPEEGPLYGIVKDKPACKSGCYANPE
jgi:hypothetical protein